MKKMIFFAVLSCLSNASYAQSSVPISETMGESSCYSTTKGNLTGCFYNHTNESLDGYDMAMNLLYEDGSFISSLAGQGGTRPSSFTVISTSSLELKKNKIVSVSFSIVRGSAMYYQVMPGCSTEFTPTSISKSVISIYKNKNGLHCK
jgi:hypothetical protein